MKKLSYILIIALQVLLLQSCTSNDREIEIEVPKGDYANGMFILNEGGYTYANASVSFVDASGTVFNNIFFAVNEMKLGDVAQSMAFYKDKAYIVMNYSNTIQVVNRYTFEHLATIENQILNPRFIAFTDGKGYVTNWGDPANSADDYVAVIDLETNTVKSTIPVSEGPEKILENNGVLYVAHKGGWGYGNSISVINNNAVSRTIDVADVPSDMVVDNNDLFVLCSGKADWTGGETAAELFKINLLNNETKQSLKFGQGVHPGHLSIANQQLFYIAESEVFSLSTNNFQLPTQALFSTQPQNLQVLYGFKVHNNNIYVADAKDYVANGEIFIYNMQGNLKQNFNVQIIPNGFYFND